MAPLGLRSRLGLSLLAACGLRGTVGSKPNGPSSPFATTISGVGAPPLGQTPIGTPGTSTMQENSLANVDPLAVCNDGSPAAYYFAPGSGANVNTYLVYLEGAMFCWSKESCDLRYTSLPWFMSSTAKPWSSQFAQGGIFATDGSSPWGTANRVYLKYCSSDLWAGDAPASDATFGYEFRGSRIVQATISDLVHTHGLGATPGARLLFGGCSAGAIGAMNWLDSIPAMVPPGVQVSGFLDGAALLDIQPRGWTWSDELETLPMLIANMTSFSAPVFPPYCAQQFPGEEWKCLIGQYRMPLIQDVPMFINAPQFDMFNLMYDTDNYLPNSPSQLSFVEEFQAGTLALLAALPPSTGVFSPTCLVHCLSGGTEFNDITAAGVTLDAALQAWYFGGQQVLAVSSCVGWQCTNACGVDMHTSQSCMMGDPGCQLVTAMKVDPGATTSTDQAGLDTSTVPAAMAAVVAREQALTQTQGQQAQTQQAPVQQAPVQQAPAPQAPAPHAAQPTPSGTVSAVEPSLSAAQQQQLLLQQQQQQQAEVAQQQQQLVEQQQQQQLVEQQQAQQKLDQDQAQRRLLAADGGVTPERTHAMRTMQRMQTAAQGCCGAQR